MQCQPVLFFLRRTGESAFRWGAKLVMSKALLSEAYEVTGMAVLAFRSWKGNNAIVLNRPQRVVSNLAVSICFIFFFERTGESAF